MRQVALIGAGFIAGAHLSALRQRKDVRVAAVVDPSRARAETLARAAGGAAVFESIEALIAARGADAAHVLTPPPLHRATAEPLLRAGVDVLLEKPMAETVEDCAALLAAAEAGGAAIAVNHNFTEHPVHVRARDLVRSGQAGRLRRLQLRYAAPLRQMAARQFGHWMFSSPRNLLLEQAVHPLSQVDDLLGPIRNAAATPGPVRRPAEGIELVTDWMLDLECEGGLAQVQVVLGANFPSWTLSLLCDDGVIDADMFEGRVSLRGPNADIPPLDYAKRNLAAGAASLRDGFGGLIAFGKEIARLAPASDGFNRSMQNHVAKFYESLATGEKPREARGRRLVEVCTRAAETAQVAAPKATRVPREDEKFDVAVIGGTGFIGQHLVRQLLVEGAKVAVMARNTANLPDLFHDPRVGVFKGSIGDEAALTALMKRCHEVVNLAHGGGGASREEIAENMVGGAQKVAAAAKAAGAERLIFVSSSAALYLGDADETVSMATPPDPHPDDRGDYARAKVLAERAVLATEGLAVVNLRPAVVVGEGGAPFHSALGAYENETHCAGWNDGTNPLPFVLAEDVASAVIAALRADLGAVTGKSFNLVGDVRWSARRYTEELAAATGRPLKFHPSAVWRLLGDEWLKFAVKKIAGRSGVQAPSGRDLKSRGMVAAIDTSAEKQILGWVPCADEDEFRRRAILVHAEGGS